MNAARAILILTPFLIGVGPAAAQTRIHLFNGDDSFDHMGSSMASAGDVNGDGVPDIIAGAWRDETAGSNAGMARV